MAEDIFLLDSVKGELLDNFLAIGWYRMGKYVFTTHSLCHDGIFFDVLWLRYVVKNISLSAKNKKLISGNEHFTVTCWHFSVTGELESLHAVYGQNLKFATSPTLEDLLMDLDNAVFDTHVIEIRDNGRLIAAGIFDMGAESIAGIKNIYDPEYKKYSLGKYLMLLKYQFCLDNNIRYYYPGYFSPDNPLFDYKLFLDKNATEVYLPQPQVWLPFRDLQKW